MKWSKLIIVGALGLVALFKSAFSMIDHQPPKPAQSSAGSAIVSMIVIPTPSTTVVTPTTPTTTETNAATSTNATTTKAKVVAQAAPAPKPTPTAVPISAPTPASTSASTSASSQTITATENSAPITEPLADQKALASETVAIVCVKPRMGGNVGILYFGTGVIVNKNGYILTNEHVLGDSTSCYMGRPRAVPAYFQSDYPAPTIALYYSLQVIGKGVGVTDPSDPTQTSSMHDFAVLKIGAKMPRSEWQSDQAPPDIQTVDSTYIPWATDAEYAAFSPDGTFPAINIDFNYQPVRGDLLSMGGYIASTGAPNYTFTNGNLSVFSSTTISVAMPTGQGLSGSPIVDNQGNLVALNFAMDCGEWQGCYTWDNPDDIGFSSFTYGNQALALTIPFINQAMQQDLGFSLQDLTTRQ